jgi:hypothetical protein
MDIPHHVIYVDRWYATWFLVVREIYAHEVGSPKEWLRNTS